MKRAVLLLAFIWAFTGQAFSQRLVLVEEFSGENCSSCATENPAFNTLMEKNTGKALMLRYMVPIPSAGPLYNANPGLYWTRMVYYKCNFAPWGEVDGKVVGSGQYPALISNITQKDIDDAYDVTPPFKIVLVSYYNKTKDSITAVVKITANQNYNKANMKVKLRVALVESLHFATAPGLNGEKDFENVVRRTYPDINGTSVSNYWTSGQTQTLTIKGLIPTYVDKANSLFVAAWLQNDSTKDVLETRRTTINNSVGVSANTGVFNEAAIYPNPANTSARLELKNQQAQPVRVKVTDAVGRQVYAISEQTYGAGTIGIDIPTADLSNGLYYVTVFAGDGTKSLALEVLH